MQQQIGMVETCKGFAAWTKLRKMPRRSRDPLAWRTSRWWRISDRLIGLPPPRPACRPRGAAPAEPRGQYVDDRRARDSADLARKEEKRGRWLHRELLIAERLH